MTIKESDIIKINELKKQGLTYTEIAKEVGCGKSTVFMYLKEENKFLYKNETYK